MAGTAHPRGGIGSISVLATASMILSLASVGGCVAAGIVGSLVSPAALVAVLVLPLPALLGAILGALALRSIRNSQGAVGGRTMAIIGLFVGLIAAVLQGAVAGSAFATYWPVKQTVAPVVEEFATAIQSGDLASARTRLSPSASQVVTDERLYGLLAPSVRRYGTFRGATFGLDVFVESFKAVREAAANAQAAGQASGGGPGDLPKPIGLSFANGRVIAYVFVDQGALSQRRVEILDMLVTPRGLEATTLLPDGPAVQAARSLGVPVADPSAPAQP